VKLKNIWLREKSNAWNENLYGAFEFQSKNIEEEDHLQKSILAAKQMKEHKLIKSWI
jgi:hypothetical protein